jgi:hypothetical protein
VLHPPNGLSHFGPVCPANTNLQNCQDITSLIGIYLSAKPSGNFGSFEDNSTAWEESTITSNKQIMDPNATTSELREFQMSLENAIANNRLQEIVESLYSGISPESPVYVIPNEVTSSLIIGGGGNNGSESGSTSDNKDDENNNESGQGDNVANGSNSTNMNDDNDNDDEGTENGNNGGDEVSFPAGDDNDQVTGTNDDKDDDIENVPGQGDGGTSASNSTNIENDNDEGTENIPNANGGGGQNSFPPESDNDPSTSTGDEKDDSEGSESDNDPVGNNSTNIENDKEEEIDNSGDKEKTLSPESGNDPVTGGNSSGNSSSTNSSNGDGADSEGVSGNGAWLPGPSHNSTSTTVAGGTLPAISDNSLNAHTSKNGMSMSGIVGIVVLALVAVMVVISLMYKRRRSNGNRSSAERSGSSTTHKGKKTKSLVDDVDEEDMISSDSSRKSSLGRFLYAGVQGDSMLPSSLTRRGTDHSRGTLPTVTSTISENTDGSVTSSVADNGRGTETWRKDEVFVPMNTTRGLLCLDRVNEEKGSEDEEDECDPLFEVGESSDGLGRKTQELRMVLLKPWQHVASQLYAEEEEEIKIERSNKAKKTWRMRFLQTWTMKRSWNILSKRRKRLRMARAIMM